MKKLFIFLITLMLLSTSVFAGFETLAVGPVDFISNDPTINGKAFLLTGVAGFDGSSYIKASQIVDTADNAKATKDFYINTVQESYSCDYAFNPDPYDGRITYMHSYVMSSTWYFTEDGCKANVPTGYTYQGYALSYQFQKWCLYSKPEYKIGLLSDPMENFKLQFGAGTTADSQPFKSEVISTADGVTTSTIKNGTSTIAQITWLGGGLKAPGMCPSGSSNNVIALQNPADSKNFILITKSQMDEYKNIYTAMQVKLQNQNYPEKQILVNFLSDTNGILNNLKKVTTIKGSNGNDYTIKDGDGKKTIVLERPFTLPSFNMRIKADFVGVVINTAQPKIISPTSLSTYDIVSGVGKYVDVVVQNTGTADATFSTKVDCGGQIVLTPVTLPVKAGQQETFKVFANTASRESIKAEKCTITVYDTNNADKKDSITISVNSEPTLKDCGGVKTSCLGDYIAVCENNAPTPKTKCDYGCTMLDNFPVCKTKNDTIQCNRNNVCDATESESSCPQDCGKKPFNMSKFLIFMMLGIMGGLYAFTKAEFNGTKKQKMIFRFVVAIVVAIALFIGLPILISILLPTLGIALGFMFVIAGAFGLWFVNSTLPNSKFKLYADLALVALLLIGFYALYLGITAFTKTVSIFGM